MIPSILQMVDEYQIAFNPAVEISYLTEEHQRMLKEEMDACQATPSLTQSRTSLEVYIKWEIAWNDIIKTTC